MPEYVEMADVVPRHMLTMCKDLLRRALAKLADQRKDPRMTQQPTLRDAIERFRDGLANEVEELEDQLVAKREELDKADDVLGDLDEPPAPPRPKKPKSKPRPNDR